MRASKIWVAAAMLPLGAMACAETTAPETENIVGEWRWMESSGGLAGVRYSPADGYTVRLRFADGAVEAFRNDSLIARTPYQWRNGDERGGPSITLGQELPVFRFGAIAQEQSVRRPHADTLILSDPCCDRFSHGFVPIR